jgi:hypothetical protein
VNEKWNAWDVPFYVTPGSKPAAPIVGEAPAAPATDVRSGTTGPFPVAILKLADGGSRTAERIMAILMAFGAILAGVAVAGAFLFLGFVLSFGSVDSGDVTFAIVIGSIVAVVVLVLAGLTYSQAGRPQQIILGGDALEISYASFGHPMRIARALVRVVALDDKPMRPFRNNPRFPIAGTLPDDVYADALDNVSVPPWEDLDPERFKKRRIPIGPWQRLSRRTQKGYTHDDPAQEGWASGGASDQPLPQLPKDSYLWSSAGSSLPFLRISASDVPNLALVFHETLCTPRPHWWWHVLPLNNSRPSFRGGRAVRGMLLRVKDPAATEAAFARWGVVRPITAEDVLDEGLLVAKPLTGARSIAYAGIMVASIVMQLIFRHLR